MQRDITIWGIHAIEGVGKTFPKSGCGDVMAP